MFFFLLFTRLLSFTLRHSISFKFIDTRCCFCCYCLFAVIFPSYGTIQSCICSVLHHLLMMQRASSIFPQQQNCAAKQFVVNKKNYILWKKKYTIDQTRILFSGKKPHAILRRFLCAVCRLPLSFFFVSTLVSSSFVLLFSFQQFIPMCF